MDKTENKHEQSIKKHETHKLEHRRRLEFDSSHVKEGNQRRHRIEAQRSAETRREKGEKPQDKEELKSAENRSLGKKTTPDEVASHRRQLEAENRKTSAGENRSEPSSTESEVQNREYQKRLERILDETDPHWREADRRTAEGKFVYENDSNAARIFCHVAGTSEHSRFEDEINQKELRNGRIKGIDFDTEAVIKHPDGKNVRLDYVDYRKDIIVDRKPIGKNESTEEVIQKHYEQRNRHIEAYEHNTGRKVLEYRYSLYPSPKDI